MRLDCHLFHCRSNNTARKQVEADQKQLDQRLRDQQFYTRSLIESNIDALMTTDPAGIITDVNKQMEALTGCTRDELIGAPFKNYFTDPVRAEAGIKLVLSEKKVTDYELTARARDGKETVVSYNATTFYDRDRKLQGVFAAARDVTDQKQASQYARSLIEASLDPLVTISPEGKITDVNAGSVKVTGVPREKLIGTDFSNYFTEPEKAREGYQQVFAQGFVTDYPLTIRHEQGRLTDVLYNASVYKDVQGNVLGVFAAARDITARMQAEAALAARAADLVRADRSKDEFLAMLAHELRNPLAPLRNAAEILQTKGASAEECGDAQQIIQRQIENMTRMIDDLLDVSRITEGKIELRRQPVALADILTAAASVARSGISARRQTLELSLPREPIFLNADATRLEQVFGNLLGNACKYSDPGSTISLSSERAPAKGTEPPEVIVRVRDNGMGVAPELLPHIFDLFVQATRALDRAHGGLGIGLTLVQRLVKLHGGSVEARSEGLGHGSEFIVRLPILAAPPAEYSPPTPPAAHEAPRRILIVDDNEDSTRSMAILQRRRGHETRTAFTGPDAVAVAAEFLPEVVLLDIGLPGMDGFEVARRLRAMPALAGAFLVAMSGYGSDEDRVEARAAGFDEYLVKPVDLAVLRTWLRSRS